MIRGRHRNGVLQQLVQPFAIATIAGGALFGAIGLILAAPLTSAITRISTDLAQARSLTDEASPPPAVA